MSSLVTNSTGNCKLGHDCRRVRSHRRRDSTRQLSRVGGVGTRRAVYKHTYLLTSVLSVCEVSSAGGVMTNDAHYCDYFEHSYNDCLISGRAADQLRHVRPVCMLADNMILPAVTAFSSLISLCSIPYNWSECIAPGRVCSQRSTNVFVTD